MSELASQSESFAEQGQALEVLREVWRGRSQGAADLGDRESGACKRMAQAGVGFDEFGGETFGGRTEEARIASWRARLEREGKLSPSGGTLRDIAGGTDGER